MFFHSWINLIEISVFDPLEAKDSKESTKFDLLYGLNNLKNEIDIVDKLDSAEKSKLAVGLEKLSQL